MIASRPLLSKKSSKNFFGRLIFLGEGKMYFLSLRGGKTSREKYFSITVNIIVTKFYQKLTNILDVMTGKIRKITVFFMFFKIQMTFILEPRGLHGNKKFEIEGGFISFKWEKKFFISLE